MKYEFIEGKNYKIHAYKHNGNIHRSWDQALYLGKEENAYVFYNNKTKVTESDGRTWRTREPAILYFYEDSWFNIIGQIKRNGIFYYCNIATPFVLEEDTIKYIDYDLDLRVFPNFGYRKLDNNEYLYHKKIMNYSNKIDYVVNYEFMHLVEMVKLKKTPFNHEDILKFAKEAKKYSKKCN